MSEYTGPLVGYDSHEMAMVIGTAVMNELAEQGMEITRKPIGKTSASSARPT